jgi:hypothetical protein
MNFNMSDSRQTRDLCFLAYVPSEVLRIIANYFLSEKDQDRHVFQFTHDWRNFMNTKKLYFEKWKKESQIIVLRYPLVEQFYQSAEVQQKVFQYIIDPRKQLELFFNYDDDVFKIYGKKFVDLNLMNNVKRISIHGAKVKLASVDVEQLEFINCSFDNFSMFLFPLVKTLVYKDYFSEEVIDLAPLNGVENGFFDITRCINYHCLANLKSLDLSYCDSVTSVSCFQHIPKLRLSACPSITDIGSLAGCYELDLSCNDSIDDVSAFGNVHKLILCNCVNITDVSSLGNVHTLDLSECSNITDVSGLQSIVVLNISGCFKITTVNMLTSLHELRIRGCTNINSLLGLSQLKNLEVDDKIKLLSTCLNVVSRLTEFTIRSNMFAVETNSKGIIVEDSIMSPMFLSCLQSIVTLKIYRFNFLEEFPTFPFIRSLSLWRCDNFTSLPLLHSLGYLEISHCDNLQFLTLFGANDLKYPIYNLEIKYCLSLQKVSFQRTISRCEIASCERLGKMEVLSQIDLLRLNDCQRVSKIINRALIVCLDVSHETRFCFNQVSDINLDEVSSKYPSVKL